MCHVSLGLAFSPDGRWLAVSHRMHVEVWDVGGVLAG